MLATIDLDDNFGLQAEEIDDIGSKDLLTSKLDAVESSTAQAIPQAPLRLGRILAQGPGQTVHRSLYPLTPTLPANGMDREKYVNHAPGLFCKPCAACTTGGALTLTASKSRTRKLVARPK